MGIDYDLWLRFSTQYEYDYVYRPLLYYRLWARQMSKNCKARYPNGIETMKNFLRDFPGALDKSIANEAWTHTYMGFGQCMQGIDRGIGPALSLYLRALHHKPSCLPAWKAIIKAFLNRQKRASP